MGGALAALVLAGGARGRRSTQLSLQVDGLGLEAQHVLLPEARPLLEPGRVRFGCEEQCLRLFSRAIERAQALFTCSQGATMCFALLVQLGRPTMPRVELCSQRGEPGPQVDQAGIALLLLRT